MREKEKMLFTHFFCLFLKFLCIMTSLTGCVNCVRWSGDGKYLASGGDDKLVIIWQTSK